MDFDNVDPQNSSNDQQIAQDGIVRDDKGRFAPGNKPVRVSKLSVSKSALLRQAISDDEFIELAQYGYEQAMAGDERWGIELFRRRFGRAPKVEDTTDDTGTDVLNAVWKVTGQTDDADK